MAITTVCPDCRREHRFADIVTFRATCEQCSADLHVCVACRHYEPMRENQCDEDQADPVRDKRARNLCEYFRPSVAATTSSTDDAKAKLYAAFGLTPTPKSLPPGAPSGNSFPPGAPSGNSFPPGAPSGNSPTAPSASKEDEAAATAKAKLEALFKKPSA